MLRFAQHDSLWRTYGVWSVIALLALRGVSSAEVLVLTRDRALRGDGVSLNTDGIVEVRRGAASDSAPSDSGVSELGVATERVKLDECLLIRFEPLARRSRARTWVVLRDGRRLSGEGLTPGVETLTLRTGTLPNGAERTVAFELDEVVGLFVHADRPEAAEWPDSDTRVIRANGDVMDVPFAELTEAGVIIDIDPSVDPILLPLNQVRAVLWPREEPVEEEDGADRDVLLVLRTGERLRGRLAALTGDRVELVAGEERLFWPAGELEAIWPGRVRQAAVEVGEVASLAEADSNGRPRLRINRNGLGGPMRVGGRMYAEGIGLQGQTAVEIKVPPGALWFTGGVGVDADAGSFARLAFVAEVDGEVVEEISGLTPGQAARRVAVRVEGKRLLTLKVLAEHSSDVGCLGDVVDATFIVAQP